MSRPFQHSVTPLSSAQPEFSVEERRLLLGIAHRSILSAFDGQAVPEASPSLHLSEHRGVFTTLYLHGSLRGCVGYPMPVAPLHRAVTDSARAAAFEDTRFRPVTQPEAQELKVSLSVLSRLVPVQPEEVAVGRHGLVISLGAHRGLLLPQVPVEYNWDRETFLEQTCRKAGLDSHAWRHGATVEAFTAEVFGDVEASE
jgi:AmmeMemoRadiSam system protein A